MLVVDIETGAALHRLSAALERFLTNSQIEAIAKDFKVKAEGTNKADRILSAVTHGLERLRKRDVETLLTTLVMAAHQRHVLGKVVLTHEDLDEMVRDIRKIGLEPGELANKRWRGNLGTRMTVPVTPIAVAPVVAAAPNRDAQRVAHPKAIEHIRLLHADGTNPQQRGRQLELIILAVLGAENLAPSHNIVAPGSQIDLGFTLDGQHYLVESKWEESPIGGPSVTKFIENVRRRAEGTFGVFLSMSGFIAAINAHVTMGARLNSVGIDGVTFMTILEGRATWSEVVRAARRAASERATFFSGK